MENVRYSLFDLFAYTMPGAILLTGLVILSKHTPPGNLLEALTQLCEKTNPYLAVLFIIVAYVAGFITSLLSSLLMYFFRDIPVFKTPAPIHNPHLSTSARYVLIRELSKENFKYIETWNVMKRLSANIAMIILLLLIAGSIVYFNDVNRLKLLLLVMTGLVVSYLLIKNAFMYQRWTVIEMDNCIHQFDLTNEPRTLLQEAKEKKD
jgi:hypothetical protein